MSKRMTTEQRLTPATLEAIRKRAEAASEGPWKFTQERNGVSYVEAEEYPEILATEVSYTPDAAFISEARSDIPALLAEDERLRTALEFYADESNNHYFADYPDSYLTESAVMEDDGEIAREAIRNDSED